MYSRFFSSASGSAGLRCDLCPRRCHIPEGGTGACKVRGNREGKGHLPRYGYITALAVDPVEKKPLYHFRPGSKILSAGFAGCNLRCPFCQNWHISQTSDVPGRFVSPEELVSLIRAQALPQIAFTYSEPLVHGEFLIDTMRLNREGGIANVLVTNGCINSEAAEAILSQTDAVNIDLKCFSAETYSSLLGGDLPAVLDFIRLAVKTGVHTEITTLVIPGLNDSEKELGDCAEFIAGLSQDQEGMGLIPWHLSAYHPDYRWETPPTNPLRLAQAARRAEKSLRYVYTGNIPGEHNDTRCPSCGHTLIQRRSYSINPGGLQFAEKEGKTLCLCAACKTPAPIRV